MTEKQHRWYLREWSRAWREHWCGTRDGEALARPGRPSRSEPRDQVVAAAQALVARQGGGRLTAEALRHACHIVALGKDVSSWHLTNKQIDRVVATFRLLAGQIPPARLLETAAPTADPSRAAYAIAALDLPPDYIAALSRDKFGTADWRGLGALQLHQLLVTCKARAVARAISQAKRVNLASTL